MAAAGIPDITPGTAPDLAAGDYDTIIFEAHMQQYHIKNNALMGGSVLRWGFRKGPTHTDTLLPGESCSLFNVRVNSVAVGSDTAGSTCAYTIITVRQ